MEDYTIKVFPRSGQIRIIHPNIRDKIILEVERFDSVERRADVLDTLLGRFYKSDVPKHWKQRYFPHYIPTDIAVEGKPAIAAYLFSMKGESIEQISQEMDVKNRTVEQYISDFLKQRR